MSSVEIDELIEEYMNTVISHLIFGSSLISINLVSNAAIACAVTFLWADVSVFLSQESVWIKFGILEKLETAASFINHLCVAFRSHVLTSNFKRFQVYRRFDWLSFPVSITTWFRGKKWFTIRTRPEEFCIYSKRSCSNQNQNKLVNAAQFNKLSLFVANWAALIFHQRSSNAAFAERMTAIESHLKMFVRIVDLVADFACWRKSCKNKRDNKKIKNELWPCK